MIIPGTGDVMTIHGAALLLDKHAGVAVWRGVKVRRIGGMQVRRYELAWGTHDEKTIALSLPVSQAGA